MARKRTDVRAIAEAIMRRAPKGHAVLLGDRPTLEQRLLLIAAGIDGRPLIVLSGKPAGMDEGTGTVNGSPAPVR